MRGSLRRIRMVEEIRSYLVPYRLKSNSDSIINLIAPTFAAT